MSNRDWLRIAALGGCLISILYFLLPTMAVSEERPKEQKPVGQYAEPEADPEKTKAAFDSWFWRVEKGEPNTYRHICKHPEDRDYADLCQQWRTAEAAEESARWAMPQFLANIVAILLLCGTIIYTHLTFRLTSKTSRVQLRAYVMVKEAAIENIKVDSPPSGSVTIENSGGTPAYDVSFWARGGVQHFPIKTELPTKRERGTFDSFFPMAPGGTIKIPINYTVPLNQTTYEAIHAGKVAVMILGQIRYRDVFGHDHVTDFCLYCGGNIGVNGHAAPYFKGNNAT